MNQEIKIERLAYGGEGIGYLHGKVCFVENALPGERVLAFILQDKKKFTRARTVEVLAASPNRVEPPCPHYEKCGGCQYQHVTYAEELKWKELQVREHLQHQLKLDPKLIKPIIPSSNEYHYRNSATLHRVESSFADIPYGFIGRDNLSVIPIKKCLLLNPNLDSIFNLPADLGAHNNLIFKLDDNSKIFSSLSDTFFEIQIGSERIVTHSQCFFQNNLHITRLISQRLHEWIKHESPQRFIDLYCGVGTFTLLAAKNVPEIILAEEHPKSIAALEKNIGSRNLDATLIEGKVEDKFGDWLKQTKGSNEFLFLDPPRKGMDTAFAEMLCKQKRFNSIAYLSCHLGTLTRDLGLLLKNGFYRVEECIPFDMFPRTKHIEVLTRLKTLA